MLERLSLPPKKIKEFAVEELASPADGFPPMETSAAYAFDRKGSPAARLGISMFKKEATGQNSLESDELVVFDTVLGIFDGGRKVKLDQFDLIRILNLNLM